MEPSDLYSEEEILALYAKRQAKGTTLPEYPFASLEDLITSPEGFGLTTATPLQRAICRIVEGIALGDLWDEPSVRAALGGVEPKAARPSEVIVVAGIRTFKSMLVAANAIHASQTCDLSILSSGEVPRYSVLSLKKDNARVVMTHILGALSKPALAPFRIARGTGGEWKRIIDETGTDDAVGTEFLWHPSGRPVELRVVAGERAGGSLVSRWSLGCGLDEAPRMVGASEGVVNYDDARNAVRSRLLPGAQLFSVGSPWQPYGPIYDIVQSDWGHPSASRVVIKAPGPAMNPIWWTKERCDDLARDPKNRFAYQTDVLGEFADAEESIFSQNVIAAATRRSQDIIPFTPGHDYVAAMDPATRGNAWTLVVADRVANKKRVVLAKQWIGSATAPLSPRLVLAEVATILGAYHIDYALSDQWAGDAIRDLALELGFNIIIEELKSDEKVLGYLSMAAQMQLGLVELPQDPDLAKDLKMVKRMPTTRGVTVQLPNTPDGRHCDYAPALLLALRRWLDEEKVVDPKPGEEGYWQKYAADLEQQEVDEFAKNEATPWWAKGNEEDRNELDSVEAGDPGLSGRLDGNLW